MNISKKTIISILYCLLIIMTNTIEAQVSPSVKLSSNLNLSKRETLGKHILSDSNGHVILTVLEKGTLNNPEIFLNSFDNNFKLKNKVKLTSDKRSISIEDAINLGNKIYVISKERDIKADKLKYHLVPFDKQLIAGKPKKITEFELGKKEDDPKIEINYSQDSSLAAFIFYVDNNRKKENFEMFIYVMNKENDKVWSQKVLFQKNQNVVKYLSSSLNNEGNVYLVIKENEGDNTRSSKRVQIGDHKEDKPAYDVTIYKLNGSKEEKKEIKIEVANSFIVDCNIKVLPNGNLNLIGLHGTSKKLLIDGVFSIMMHGVTDSIYFTTKKNFTEQDLVLMSEDDFRKRKDGEGLHNKFKFLDYHTRQDGSTTIVIEENFSEVHRGDHSEKTLFITNEAIVINLEPTGEIKNIVILPKKLSFSHYDYYNSSVVLFTEEGTHLIHLDDIDNINKPYGTDIKQISSLRARDCVLVDIYLKNDGKIEKTVLLSREDTKALFMPKLSKKISANEIFFLAKNMSRLTSDDNRIGILTY